MKHRFKSIFIQRRGGERVLYEGKELYLPKKRKPRQNHHNPGKDQKGSVCRVAKGRYPAQRTEDGSKKRIGQDAPQRIEQMRRSLGEFGALGFYLDRRVCKHDPPAHPDAMPERA